MSVTPKEFLHHSPPQQEMDYSYEEFYPNSSRHIVDYPSPSPDNNNSYYYHQQQQQQQQHQHHHYESVPVTPNDPQQLLLGCQPLPAMHEFYDEQQQQQQQQHYQQQQHSVTDPVVVTVPSTIDGWPGDNKGKQQALKDCASILLTVVLAK